jgi:hypothetical protein
MPQATAETTALPLTRRLARAAGAGLAGATELELMHEPLPEIAMCLRIRAGWLEAWQRLKKLLLERIPT